MRLHRSRGFTLIELLVVVAIIGVLASLILAALYTARTEAADARTQTELQQISNIIYDAEGEKGQSLLDIIGTHATDDACNGVGDLRGSTGACYTNWIGYLADIQSAKTTYPNISIFARDAWGSPFIIDVGGDCGVTGETGGVGSRIMSAGPNGVYESFYVDQGGDDIVYHSNPC